MSPPTGSDDDPTKPGRRTNGQRLSARLDGVKGESKDDAHKETIEIASWSLGASNPTSVGSAGMSAGKVSYSDLSVMISLEKASVELLSRVSTGKVIKKAVLYGRKAGDDKRQDY